VAGGIRRRLFGKDGGAGAGEIAIVGAGVMGLATAAALARAGRHVTVYEQFELGHKRGSSHGATRIFRFAYPQADWVNMAQEALPGWRALEEETGETLLDLPGLLEFSRDQASSSQAALEASGAAYELLDPAEVERRFGVGVPPEMSALYQPDAGVVFAEKAQRALLEAATRRGATLQQGTRIRSLDDLDAEVVVVTAGAWAQQLLATAGIALPVVPTLETVAYFRLERDGPTPSVVAEISNGHGFYALMDPTHGLKVGHHKAGRPTDPDRVGEPDAEIVGHIATWARERFRLADPDPVATDTCLYTNTLDERFILERRGRVVIGSACSGHGFKFAPVVGGRLAKLATG
jgi:sarcosine oxidase